MDIRLGLRYECRRDKTGFEVGFKVGLRGV